MAGTCKTKISWASPVHQVEQPSHSPRRLSEVSLEMNERNRSKEMSSWSTSSVDPRLNYPEFAENRTTEESRQLLEQQDDHNLHGEDMTLCSTRSVNPQLNYPEFAENTTTLNTLREQRIGLNNQTDLFQEKYSIDSFLKMNVEEPWNVNKIVTTITAKELCLPKDDEDHIEMIFKINKKLKELADVTTENTELLQSLADKVEDFAVKLLDQVRTKEEASIRDGDADRYGSLFSEMTKKAIIYEQKKFISHPFLFKRVKMRWQRGSPFTESAGILHFLLWLLLIMIDTLLTPFLLPLIGYVYYRDQKNKSKRTPAEEHQSKNVFERYFDYMDTSVVILIKTQIMKVILIVLHCRICLLGSTVLPSIEEYFVLLFFLSMMLSEYEQWSTSEASIRSNVYLKDMWNWIDLLTMAIYIIIFILRVVVIIRGGDPFHNRLLEIVNYFYGFNTMLLILRSSSILVLSAVFGPLQMALFRMIVDLTIILVQFAFVIVAFSMTLAKIHSAEMSYLISKNQTANSLEGYEPYCTQGKIKCFYKAARQLLWSVFGIMESTDLESHTSLTSDIVQVLYFIFLVLSVIMLVNILVALLTNTFERYRTNWEEEWKFGLAVMEEQYTRRHAIVIPYNILSYPIKQVYFARHKNSREEKAKKRKENYDKYLRERFIPKTTERYLKRYQGSFPLSGFW